MNAWKQRVEDKAKKAAEDATASDIAFVEELLDVSEADVAKLRGALETVHDWLVCHPLTTADDMAQSFPAMTEKAGAALGRK